MRYCLTFALLLTLGLAPTLAAQQAGDRAFGRADAFVAATRSFSFFSDARVNLHDFLVWRLSSETPVEPRPECLGGRPAGERAALERASGFYDRTFSGRDPGHDRLMLDLRYHLIGHPDVELGPDSTVSAAVEHLDAALPAYRACWWAEHDQRNRAWVAALLTAVVPHEDSLAVRLSRLYAAPWEPPIPVDVAGYVNWSGANTIVNPDHILISAVRRNLRGNSGLEILFHEASHTLVHPRRGAIAEALSEAALAAGRERPPGPLWHVLLFYTTGRVVQARLAETGTADYVPYVYGQGLFDRSWPEYRVPLEEHWQPYMDGRLEMREAARRIVEALPR